MRLGRDITVPGTVEDEIAHLFRTTPTQRLRLRAIRDGLAIWRAKQGAEHLEFFDTLDDAAIDDALRHNTDMMARIDRFAGTVGRPEIMVNALMAIGHIGRNRATLTALCVGPRTEAEIFMLLAEDFQPGNISGLDLMSYSDYVDLGDMHAMPYNDDSFDVILLGFVLTYTKEPKRVIDEVVRVARPGAHVAIAVEWHPDEPDAVFAFTKDLICLFGPPRSGWSTTPAPIHAVPFRHEVHRSKKESGSADFVMVVVELL